MREITSNISCTFNNSIREFNRVESQEPTSKSNNFNIGSKKITLICWNIGTIIGYNNLLQDSLRFEYQGI